MRTPFVIAFALTTAYLSAGASPYSERARLPDDMRDVAQQAADDFRMRHYDAAAGEYRKILSKYPDSLYAWSNLGVVRSQQGRLGEAKEACLHAIQLQPNDDFSHDNLAWVYYALGRKKEADEEAARAQTLREKREASDEQIFRHPVEKWRPPVMTSTP